MAGHQKNTRAINSGAPCTYVTVSISFTKGVHSFHSFGQKGPWHWKFGNHWRWAPSINLLLGQDAPLVCAPSQQTRSPHNLWRTEHTRLGVSNPPGPPTSSRPTYGRSEHLKERVGYFWPFQVGGACCRRPQAPEPRKVRWSGFYLPRVYTPCRLDSRFVVFAISPLPVCANSKIHRSREKH